MEGVGGVGGGDEEDAIAMLGTRIDGTKIEG
jgi:hypothetical protein